MSTQPYEAQAESSTSSHRHTKGVPPALELELRLTRLEADIGTIEQNDHQLETAASSAHKANQPALLRALDAKKTIDSLAKDQSRGPVETALAASTSGIGTGGPIPSHASLRRFILHDFDASRRMLSPAFAFRGGAGGLTSDAEPGRGNGSSSDSSATPYPLSGPALSVSEQLLLILEAEPKMRALERVLEECKELDSRGAAGPGRLAECQALLPDLQVCWDRYQSQAPMTDDAEEALLSVLGRYQRYIDGLSQLFIQWDSALNDMESKVTRLEKEKRSREGVA